MRSAALLRTAVLLTAGDRPAAEDLVQAALTQAYSRWGRIRVPGAAEAYVRKILVHMALRRGREPRVLRFRVEEVEAVSVDPGLQEGVVDRATLWELLGSLSTKQRTVLVLRYYEDLSEAQIAEILGCAPGTVKSHASRGIDRLRSLLEPLPHSDENNQAPRSRR